MKLIPMSKGKMLVEEKGGIYIFEYKPNEKRIRRYKESFLSTGMEKNFGFATLTTSDPKTLNEYFNSDIIDYNLLYNNNKINFEENSALFLGNYPKDKQEIIFDYISGKYDDLTPNMIYGRLSNNDTKDNPLKYFISTGSLIEKNTMANILMVQRKLYLLGMFLNGRVDIASEGDISVQAKCFDYQCLCHFNVKKEKFIGMEEQLLNQARMGTRILQKGNIFKI